MPRSFSVSCGDRTTQVREESAFTSPRSTPCTCNVRSGDGDASSQKAEAVLWSQWY